MGEESMIILVNSKSGSITLGPKSEGGGNYGHHASKSALNMVGTLLSLDLKEKRIAVGIVHVGLSNICGAIEEGAHNGTARLHAYRDDEGCRFR